MSTGKETQHEAEIFRDAYLARMDEDDIRNRRPSDLRGLVHLFLVPEKNPKYIEAQETGAQYTLRYARMEVTRAQHVLSIAPPEILDKKLDRLTRTDVDVVRTAIHRTFGNRNVAKDTFTSFKTILNYAYQKGWMKEMIAFRMQGIRAPRQKELLILPKEDLVKICASSANFRNPEERDIFYVLMTTGMRRAELACIQGKQLHRAKVGDRIVDVLDISQSFKDENQTIISTPKWDIQRMIPLAPSTAEVMRKYVKGPEDFLFHMGNSMWTDMFNYIRSHVDKRKLEVPEALDDLSAHKLRHALNTTLIENDLNDTLIQEYLAWHHQDRNKVQAGYTHIYIRGLLRVSDLIETLYALPKEEEEEFILLD